MLGHLKTDRREVDHLAPLLGQLRRFGTRGQMRWLLFEQAGSSISTALLIVVSAWLAVIFSSFGLFAPSNTTVVVVLLVASLCVAGSIFLILELDQPFGGIIHISSSPMRGALDHLGE
jgi:hypothetical protein